MMKMMATPDVDLVTRLVVDVVVLLVGYAAGKVWFKETESSGQRNGDAAVVRVEEGVEKNDVSSRKLLSSSSSPSKVDDLHLAFSEAYLKTLSSRRDRGADWPRRKLVGAQRWREEFGEDSISPALLAVLNKKETRKEALLSEDSLKLAGRVLKNGSMYWHGHDAVGRPVLWARSGLLDLRGYSRQDELDMIRACATMLELGAIVATKPDGRFAYIECTDNLSSRNFPLGIGWRVLRGCLDAFTRGFPERGSVFLVAPTTLVNRIMFALATPISPASITKRTHLLDRSMAFDRVATLLGDASKVPTFFGGPDTAHTKLPRDKEGNLDLVLMLSNLIQASDANRRQAVLFPPPTEREKKAVSDLAVLPASSSGREVNPVSFNQGSINMR